ncbi:unnamed protein product [Ectocarpus sp. 13 AM-2016]
MTSTRSKRERRGKKRGQGQASASSRVWPRPSAGTAPGQPAAGSQMTLKQGHPSTNGRPPHQEQWVAGRRQHTRQ